jgi:hypothetical protein
MIVHVSMEMAMLITNHLGTGFFVQKGTIFICEIFNGIISNSDYNFRTISVVKRVEFVSYMS